MIRRPPRSTRTTHSFPTRRASDLVGATPPTAFCPDKRITAQSAGGTAVVGDGVVKHRGRRGRSPDLRPWERTREGRVVGAVAPTYGARSEEHTSELQSLMRTSYAVFCLKKTTHKESQKATRH